MARRIPAYFPITAGSALAFRLENDKKVLDNLVKLQRHYIPDAMDEALRYAAKGAQTDISAVVRDYYTLTAKTIKRDVGRPRMQGQRMAIPLSYTPHSANQYRGRVIGTRRHRKGLGRGRGWQGLPISTRHGYSWQVFKQGERRFTPRGFLAKAPGQEHELPFERIAPRNTSRPGRSGLRVIKGPSLGGIFSLEARYGSQVRGFVGQKINDRLYTGLTRAMRRYARKL